MRDIIWTVDDDDDAEYNQHFTVQDGKQFLLYSDRDGEEWTIEYPDGTTEDLDAEEINLAQDEAYDCIEDWLNDNA